MAWKDEETEDEDMALQAEQQLIDCLHAVINRCAQESDLTVGQIVGSLHVMAASIVRENLEESE